MAKLIAEKGLLDKVLLASFDPFKILAAKKENPSLTVGIFYKKGMWEQINADNMKREYGDLPGMRQCVESAPNNGTEFMEFLFETGDLLRSTNSSFVVMDYNIYNNAKYSNNTFQTFKENYSPSLSFGAFIIDNLALTDEQRTKDDKYADSKQCIGIGYRRHPSPEKKTRAHIEGGSNWTTFHKQDSLGPFRYGSLRLLYQLLKFSKLNMWQLPLS